MIATGLTFLFGFFVALLLALLLSPLLWRRSRRVARREFEATIPTNANEIRASFDHVRAQAALTSRRREMEARAIEERAAVERAEAGRVFGESARLRETNRELEDQLARQKADIEEAASVFERHEQEFDQLVQQLDQTEHELDLRREEIEALGLRFRELTEVAEDRKRTIATLEAEVEQLSADPRKGRRGSDEDQGLVERFRGESTPPALAVGGETVLPPAAIRSVEPTGSHVPPPAVRAPSAETTRKRAADPGSIWSTPEPAKPSQPQSIKALLKPSDIAVDYDNLDEDALRDRVADIAARIVHLTSVAEGAGSPIARILASESDRDNAPLTLAGRIRRLRDDGSEARKRGEAAE